jgi:hypothetical protein
VFASVIYSLVHNWRTLGTALQKAEHEQTIQWFANVGMTCQTLTLKMEEGIVEYVAEIGSEKEGQLSFADLIQKKFGATSDEEVPELQPSPAGSLESFIQRHAHVTEEYKFYGGTITLRFDKEEHCYYRVGELGNLIRLNGVTQTVGIIDKSFMLTPWAAKTAIQKLLRIMPTEMVEGIIRIKPLTFEEFTVIALEAKGAHKEKLDEASDIGHQAHKCLEESILNAMANDPQKIVRQLINLPADEQAATAAGSGFNWMQRHNVRWEETETKIYSREFDYAGTMDGLATCDSCNDRSCCPEVFKDRLSLIDWKSSNHLKIEYLFQTASYKHAKLEEHPELNILDTWILRLGKSDEEAGKFEPWHMTPDEYEEDFQGFLACLQLTRLVDSVEERMKGQKTTIRAVKKEQRETAKAIKKEQEKLQKALDKATAKIAKEAEKVRIKAEAKATRDALKAAKHLEKAMPVTTAIAKMLNVDTGVAQENLPEGIQPRVDDVVFLGGAPCTSTSPLEASSKSDTTHPISSGLEMCPTQRTTSSQNQTAPVLETPQPELVILTEAVESQSRSSVFETETYTPTFKLPMEG